jgi:hypothetical protein
MSAKTGSKNIQPIADQISLFMAGPFDLSLEKINELITARSPGNYALGYIDGDSFIVTYVGRSDFDLNERLKDWIGQYPLFKWSYAISEKAAYEKECRNYHDFGGNEMLVNTIHPAIPEGTNLKCPVCGK